MSGHVLEAVSVGVDRGGRRIVDGIDLVADAGSLTSIVGPAGSGKTTLVLALAGLIQPSRGHVRIAVPPGGGSGMRPLVAFVPQDERPLSVLTAAETVSLPLQAQGLPKPEIARRAEHWLAAVGLEACSDRQVDELSGGQVQRLAVARALGQQAPVVIMDEATAGLDAGNRGMVLSLLLDEMRRGAALIVVSHDPDVLAHSTATLELPPPGAA